VSGELRVLGGDDRHAIAGEDHLAAEDPGRRVFRPEDEDDAREGASRGRVERQHARMRVRRPQDGDVEESRGAEVVRERPLPGDALRNHARGRDAASTAATAGA
jgi:hypothetical protein